MTDPWERIVDHLADSVLEDNLEELASGLQPGQSVAEVAEEYRNRLLKAFDAHATDPNYTHPNCGGLTDAEREALFFLAYWPHKTFWDLWLYFLNCGIPYAYPTLWPLRDSLKSKGLYPNISEKGLDIVAKLEAGGW
jgi:hypothetical protein